MALTPVVKVVDLYRHELFDNGFGVQWMDDNDENNSMNSKNSIISVRSVYNNHNSRLPAHIWRSLAKVLSGDVVMELNGVSTAGQTVAEFEKNLKLSGNRIRIRLKSDYGSCTSSSLVDPSWNSPTSFTSSIQATDEDNLSDTEYYQQKKILVPLTNGHSFSSMTNGHGKYNKSERSRSCENSLDSCGRKSSDELTISSSSLADIPVSSSNNADYDNLASINGNNDVNEQPSSPTAMQPSASRLTTQSPISYELDQKIKDAIDARLRDIDDEFELNLPVTSETVNKSVDLPSARRLAKRLYTLDGFKSTDVVRHLCKRNDFNQLVAEEYVKLFDFQGDTLDRALRKFVKQFTIIGEAQDRERVLHFFAARYLDCNPTTFTSVDACHMLTCAIMLLNTDLHDAKITSKMTFQQFSDNLHELNDGVDFSKDLLKSLYNAIKNEQFIDETTLGSDDYTDVRLSGQGTLHGYSNCVNPFLEIPDTSKSIEYMQGYVMRKCCVESDGKRTPFMRRSWKAYYASLRDMVLYLHKNDQQPATILVGDTNAIRLHHAFAQEATDYRKRQHVFRLKTADWAECLFQTSDHDLMKKWIDAINLIAASFSSPPLPAAIDSSSIHFQRPLLPSVQTRHSVFEQYEYIINQINEISRQLNELKTHSYTTINNNETINTNGDLKQPTPMKARDMIEHKDKIDYLEYELKRYEAYADRLRRHFQQLQLDYSLLKPNNNEQQDQEQQEQQHGFVGPIEAFSGVHNTQQQTFPHHQILPTRPTSTVAYKKASQSPNITMTNPNRYSYMMAVNTHPVAMKEHRL
ncbi:unnamed protein product [Rotaria magnacalcarata]|uniref:Uncharacterized protein n=5 Tax=Rotaria magnacalcarata TaxID=392030 RepID=A0A816Z3G8_9BILA|nr:unnamed protein product [Rotaria magnacalcarata]CAF1655966.1 unnamed protein product [Rotaria magnacalcarata]CAF1934592.1 unnamed protein product [Rotaria magnacalcarata]CAF2183325.1 unnamed protein product [Rotaria magnacalcarata]CAF2189441.1 unnamed protein product [Rotaria magnacalcarata]